MNAYERQSILTYMYVYVWLLLSTAIDSSPLLSSLCTPDLSLPNGLIFFKTQTSHVKLHWNPELSVLIQSIVAYLRLYETRKLVSYDNKHSLPTYLVNTNRHNIDTLFSVERIKNQQ